MRKKAPIRWFELANFALGAVLAWAAMLFGTEPSAVPNAVIVGTAIAAISVVAFYHYSAWAEWSNLLLGCWAITAPFLLGFGSAPAPMWVHVLVGLGVVTFSALQLLADRKERGLSGAAASR